ncbi:ATP-dependent helicase HrpB [Pseudoclavibacter sp. 13-3]|uniref:ATP-dependent helicase HrpB n=1 Tax=Pseudoclavibacter sp. 13-3 TaxID=2901228 RepID=UPI001E5EEED3|nr:ATP-dependent helicase HrpB [Pseudoclavibacter sp. 13-3]MCD7102394.1 ATP-dependent helicase HrpB [Pseudoclavibacter sp. 13-3]
MTSAAWPTAGDAQRGAFDLRAIGAGLPAASLVPQLNDVLARAAGAPAFAVVQAPPGSGKTTVVPPAVADAVAGRVIVTEPRRLAARAAAERLAELSGTRIGDTVGYAVRGERRVGPRSQVEFVTTGLLLRRLTSDPELTGVDAVVIDEVHERDLDADLLFAMLREVALLRGDLALIVMSATLDAQRWSSLLADGATDPASASAAGLTLAESAPVLTAEVPLHPLAVEWRPLPAGAQRLDARGVTPGFLQHVSKVVAARAREHTEGTVLAFLPGRREVDAVIARLRDAGLTALPLHGSLPASAQRAALSALGAHERRVIVATSIAETSLTVPGVHTVVDSGLSREPRLDAMREMSGLVTVPASRAAAVQRAGRAARLGPGTVVRCYGEAEFASAPAQSRPAITTADLTEAALMLALWGDPDARELTLPDAPPRSSLELAQRTLVRLGALTREGDTSDLRVTGLGRLIARMPVHPRLARAMIDGAALIHGDRRSAVTLAAEAVAAVESDAHAPGGDLPALLRGLRHGGPREPAAASVSPAAARRWKQDVRRLVALVPDRDLDHRRTASGESVPSSISAGAAVAAIAGLAYPERLARLRPGDASLSYQLASGTGAVLPRGSALRGSPWLAISEVSVARTGEGSGAIIRAAAPLTGDEALIIGAGMIDETVESEWHDGRLSARSVRRLGAIELSRTPARLAAADARAQVRSLLGTADGFASLRWSESARELRDRLRMLHRELGDPWPAVDDDALGARLDDWLAPEIERLATGASTAGLDLASALRRLLPWPDAARLDALVPERLEVPSGSRVRVRYPTDDDAPPVLAVKLQECFGWQQVPHLVDGRVPVQLQLLSPAGRPLAVTMDLASFWQDGYRQVRAEMRGRYPKHPWPEDPTAATATRGTKRAQRR